MARARSSGGHEGGTSTLMTDANKCVCDRCGGTAFHINVELDLNTDMDARANCYDELGTNASGIAMNVLKTQCIQCGLDQGRAVFITDKVKSVAGAALTMEHLDSSVANNLAGFYLIPLGAATDANKYYTISSNTAAAPTVITVSVAPNADIDEDYVIIMNFKPAALTAGS